jgi:hypothetical protein
MMLARLAAHTPLLPGAEAVRPTVAVLPTAVCPRRTTLLRWDTPNATVSWLSLW